MCCRSARWRRTRAMIRSRAVRSRVPMLAAASREVGGVADSEPRHVRRQHRQCVTGRGHASCPRGGGRDGGARSRAGERRVPITALLYGLPRNREALRRADRRGRDPAQSRGAVLPQSRHARGAGDRQGRDGGRTRPGASRRVRQRCADGRAACRAPKRPLRKVPAWTTLSACCSPRSSRSTTCGRRRSTAGALPATSYASASPRGQRE